ncbi:hypothetical protein [Gilliamella sp. wkB178]|nr:hypothetical protein [Gilliamella apicola]
MILAVIADLAAMVLMILTADLGSWVADGAKLNLRLNWELNYHLGEMSQL